MRRLVLPLIAAFAAASLVAAVPAAAAEGQKGHGLSRFGELKYGPEFKNFDYVNPNAPKGGTARFGAIGTFDTLNPYTIKGVPAAGIGGLYDTLMTASDDEPFAEYGLIAESVEVAPDNTWVLFTIRGEARFHDGSAITPEDVIWTFETLKTKGRPTFRLYYADVAKVEKVGDRGVKFTFTHGENGELPLILGQLPVLSKAYWATRDFDKTTLEAPLGSGPYKVETLEAGRSITYRRVPDYWGAGLPTRRGRSNFDVIRYDYYRDGTVALEAFKAGQLDFRLENSAKNWATGYEGPGLRDGLIKKEEIKHQLPQGMQGWGYNTRRPIFADRRVRQALAYLFDFEWSNKTLFYGAYTRSESYFSNSELASSGLPQGEELEILERYRGRIPEEVFTTPYQAPRTDGSGNIREGVREALKLLKEAGWSVKGRQLVNDKTGQPFEFEILLVDPTFERIALPFAKNLERIGVTAHVRVVDTAQYQHRTDHFDFDMTVTSIGQSLSPGNEQRFFFGSQAADEPGSQNELGVKDPVVDELIELIINAPSRASLVARTRALDRVLLHSHYVIPQYHAGHFRVAYWNKFQRPPTNPPYGLPIDSWWIDTGREQEVEKRKEEIVKQ